MSWIPFPLPIWKRISTKVWTEADTLTGFFNLSPGQVMEATYDQLTDWHIAGVPEVARADGNPLRGCLIHVNCADATPNKFTLLFERVADDLYDTHTGNLSVIITRRGRTH